MMRSGVFTDEVWAVIEPVLPSDVGRPGKRWSNHRMILEGIVWRYRVVAPWRDLPAQFGPWQTVWKRHHRWSLDGTLRRFSLLCRFTVNLHAARDAGISCLLLTALWRNSNRTSIFASLLHDRPAMASADGEVVASHSYTLCMR